MGAYRSETSKIREDTENTKRTLLDAPPTFPRIWLRRAWPQRKFRWLVRRRQAVSRYLLTSALKRNWSRTSAFRDIRATAKHHLRTWFLDWTAAPPEWNARLLQLTFCDVYLTEEFDRLFKGLEYLRGRCGGLRFFRDDRIQEWILEAKHRVGAASLNYAYLDFAKLPQRYRPKFLGGAHVWLVQISSSVIAATFVVDPSSTLQNHFRELVTNDRSEEADILRLSWRRGITRMVSYHAVGARKIEYDELFLSANAELSKILRAYLGVGLAAQGPLQTVEVIGVDVPIAELPVRYERTDDDLPRWRGVSFLHSLGWRSESWRTFSTSWYKLYPVERDDRYDIGSYQMLVSAVDHGEQRTPRASSGNEDDGLRHSLSFVHYSVGALLATDAFYRRLRRSVLEVRNEIVPILHQGGQTRRLKQLRYGQQRIARANELAYREERVWAELKSGREWAWFGHEVSDLTRPEDERLHLKRMALSSAVRERLVDSHSFAKEQMTLIRSAYREILDYRVIEVNDRLQRRVFVLTIVATLATVAALLPEAVRIAAFAVVRAWLSRWLH